jgi:hypothetical protein
METMLLKIWDFLKSLWVTRRYAKAIVVGIGFIILALLLLEWVKIA